MIRRVFSLSLIAVTLLLAYGALGVEAPPKADGAAAKLIGTWKLVSARYGGEESDVTKGGTTLKHITPVNFMWVTYDSETKEVTRTAGGTYTLEGEKYEETPRYGLGGDFENNRDKAHTFTLKIDGDTWTHNGALSSGLKIEEVWERVQAK
jgi:hypothetical protein